MDTSGIKKFLDSGAGKATKDYLIAKLLELRDIESVPEAGNATSQALEVKAQKRAYKKLREILQDLMTLSEDVRQRDPRDDYASY